MTGLFITLEGGEGAGKSTQIARLKARLEGEGYRVVATREPGGSPRAEAIRTSILRGDGKAYGPFAEALMFSSARHDHLEATIRPALRDGIIVLCDRFADSTRAYQGAMGAIEPALIDRLERVVVGQTRPDLTLILDLPAETGLARANARRSEAGATVDRFEGEELSFHKRLREAFRAISQDDPQRCRLIDATQPADEVQRTVWRAVEPMLAGKPLKKRGHATV